MKRISMPTLLEGLAQRGLADEDAARHSLRATMGVLGQRLVDDEAEALAEVVPAELAACIDRSEYDGDFSADELFERVGRGENKPSARARESAEIVLIVLGACLSPEVRTRIARSLPEQAADLLRGGRELCGDPPARRAPATA